MRLIIKNFFLLFLLFYSTVSLATDCSPTSVWGGVGTTNISDIATLIRNLKTFIVDCIAKPALMIVIVVSGFYIMASTGNPGNIQKGKVALIGAIVGISIVALAGGIEGSEVFAIVFGIIIFVISSVVK